jgi:L-cysteine:1D-myo-inositol 2-amino-2-deoxy-alpha-D-glucopyranoside ligase
MSLNLFDSRTQTVRPFTTRTPNEVLAYVCGITPNNATHLGHAFTYVQFDVLRRLLHHHGYRVNYLQNATDINDSEDVIAQANARNISWQELADYWVLHFHKQMDALNVLRPTTYMYATSAMSQIISMVTTLVEKGHAYVVENMVYFDVTTSPSYGSMARLSGKQMETILGQRGGDPHDARKRHPLDFVLWFASSQAPHWDSPWGMGRPGWHIECSAMIQEVLGDQIDIHAGGEDLMYPHHESEIAQSEAVTGKQPYVSYWLHMAMVRYTGEKMSKSIGNLVLVEDVLKEYDAQVLRYLLLTHHYRQSWEFEHSLLDMAATKWAAIQNSLAQPDSGDFAKVYEALDDDLHTERALELMHEMSGQPLRTSLALLGFVV